MNKLIEETNLNVNLMLIKWGFMRGNLEDGMIKATKSGIYYQILGFSSNLFTAIKWGILLFYPKESEMANLGNFSDLFGPKIAVESMIIIASIHYLITHLLFDFCSFQPKTMFYWIDSLKFDAENRCFSKLNLNQSNSDKFTKRFSQLIFALKLFVILMIILFVITSCFAIQSGYFINYAISIFLYCFLAYFFPNHVFGFHTILYQVSHL